MGAAETRFVRPPAELLHEAATQALQSAGERVPAERGRWIESGSNTLVLLCGGTAVRVARQAGNASQLRRSQALVDALPGLPFAVPRSTGGAVEVDGLFAVPTRQLGGTPHPAGSGDSDALRALLAATHGIDPAPLRPHLAAPRAYMGGQQWEQVLRDRVLPLLIPAVQDQAEARIDALAALQPSELTVNHGDLAGANVLWDDGHVTGVLDWDLTAIDDPAEDTASLVSWHGWTLLNAVTDPDTARRATVFRNSFPLQVLAFTILNQRPDDEVQRAITRVEARLQLLH